MDLGGGIIRAALAVLATAATPHAAAYCIHNQLDGRAIVVEQVAHRDPLRDARRLNATIPPGKSRCCSVRNLDCNPEGRLASIVTVAITIPGEPAYACGYPAGAEPMVKVTGCGTVRVMPNPRAKSASAYIDLVRPPYGHALTRPHWPRCPYASPIGKR